MKWGRLGGSMREIDTNARADEVYEVGWEK